MFVGSRKQGFLPHSCILLSLLEFVRSSAQHLPLLQIMAKTISSAQPHLPSGKKAGVATTPFPCLNASLS